MHADEHRSEPWEIEPKERREHPLYVMDAEGNRIAKCDQINLAGFVTPEQCRGNARLISAAPDLLQACRVFLAQCRCVDIHHHGFGPAFDAASAAVAKAAAGSYPRSSATSAVKLLTENPLNNPAASCENDTMEL